ncbi:MAG: hypothetical protein M1832_000822 [Thelocarpon impressellum]|nr:MAG: hypothetical protein M1832_000822 [Thelocarpon impressellum]
MSDPSRPRTALPVRYSTSSRNPSASASSSLEPTSISAEEPPLADGGDPRTPSGNHSPTPGAVPVVALGVHRATGAGSVGRRRARRSGGFLLDSAVGSDGNGHVAPHVQKPRLADKGKGRADVREYGFPQTPLTHRRHHSAQHVSVQGSPLATHVTNAASAGPGDAQAGLVPAAAASAPMEKSKSQGAPPPWRPVEDIPPRPPPLDADPAQIVNLALSLNESRRSANLSRRLSGNANGQRRLSGATPVRGTGAGGSLKQQMREHRRTSRNLSPSTDDATPRPHGNIGAARASIASPRYRSEPAGNLPELLGGVSADQSVEAREINYSFSAATLARAEKARKAIELSTQYKRLLLHLPPLKPSDEPTSNPSSSPIAQAFTKPLSRTTSARTDSLDIGRAYDPLQVIRNRKARAREKKVIDPEKDGWGDISKVKAWVDQVEADSTNPSFYGPYRVVLPPFTSSGGDAASQPDSPGAGLQRGAGEAKQKRPRNDWTIGPAECLADAYWLEQDDHKKLVEDHDLRKIYPPDFNLDGVTPRRSVDDEAPEVGGRLEHKASDLRNGTAIGQVTPDGDIGSLRGRRRQKQLEKDHPPLETDGVSQPPKHGWHRGRDQARSGSRGNPREGLPQGETGHQKSLKTGVGNGNAALPAQTMIEILRKEESRQRSIDRGDATSTVLGGKTGNERGPAPSQVAAGPTAAQSPEKPARARSISVRRNGDENRARHGASASQDQEWQPRTSLDGLDETAPNSPEVHPSTLFLRVTRGFVPSLALDLSPPRSRQVSPSPGGVTHARSGTSFSRTDRGRERDRLSDDDLDTRKKHHRGRRHSADVKRPRSSLGSTRELSPVKKLLARRTTEGEVEVVEDEAMDGTYRRGEKDNKDPESSRLRSFFRGGRIDKIVRTEVSKVGDRIMKKESQPDSQPDVAASSVSVNAPSDSSDQEDGVRSLKKPPNNRSKGSAVDTSAWPTEWKTTSQSTQSTRDPADDRRLWDLGRGKGNKTSPTADPPPRPHAHKGAHWSSRFAQLAPSKIDVAKVSADQSPALSRTPSYESAASRAGSRQGGYVLGGIPGASPTLALEGVRDADSRLNAALGIPGRIGKKPLLPVTGLLAYDSLAKRKPSDRGKKGGQRHWSISDRALSTSRTPTAMDQELKRVRALLISSGVKAQAIIRRSQEVKPLPPTLYNHTTERPTPSTELSRHHVLAARLQMQEIDRRTDAFLMAARGYTDGTVTRLEAYLDEHKERVSQVSQQARDFADGADELNRELTATCWPALRQLGRRLDSVMRRRGRRMRRIKRWGYVLLEWALLGAMWWVWVIFIISKMFRGILTGVVRGVRWFFWM